MSLSEPSERPGEKNRQFRINHREERGTRGRDYIPAWPRGNCFLRSRHDGARTFSHLLKGGLGARDFFMLSAAGWVLFSVGFREGFGGKRDFYVFGEFGNGEWKLRPKEGFEGCV